MQPVRVSLSMGFTRNLGDFNSFKVEIGADDDVREGEKPNDTLARLRRFVEPNVIGMVREAEQEAGI